MIADTVRTTTGIFNRDGPAFGADHTGLDADDRARLLPVLLGVTGISSRRGHLPRTGDGQTAAWVFDEESGMAYVVE